MTKRFSLLVLLLILASCHSASSSPAGSLTVIYQPPKKTNILWLVVEDMSPILSVYGDNTIATPNISQLAAEGVTYTNVYSPSGVCAPSRAALALGMYPSSIGANHMRTTSNTEQTGLPIYEAVPPAEAKMLSHYLGEQGYYTSNNYKTDYQFTAPKAAWNDSSVFAHWRNREPNQPFFAVVNFTTTHESGLFEPYGIREIEKRHYLANNREHIAQLPQHHSLKTGSENTPLHLSKDTPFSIPPYLPNTDLVKRDMWKMYNNLAETDRQIGAVLQQLKDDGLYDNSIIFFYADHGGPLPRQKRLIYDSGIKVPLIIRFPNALNAGHVEQRLVSFVDFAPTVLALAGMDIPSHMHGDDFIQRVDNERKFIHAAADRFDEVTDSIRAVKDERYKYIRNYRPEQGYYLPLAYREKIPSMQELLRLKRLGQLSNDQRQWFREHKPVEELFDTTNDPHELINLASDPRFASILEQLSQEMDRWLLEIGDNPTLPERQLIETLWQGREQQPATATPTVEIINDKAYLLSDTDGAVISYQLRHMETNHPWRLYMEPIDLQSATSIQVVAHRLGYKPSDIATINLK